MTTDNEFPLGDMIMIKKEEFESMEKDLAYWVAATTMLSELLEGVGLGFEVNETSVAEYLIRKNEELL